MSLPKIVTSEAMVTLHRQNEELRANMNTIETQVEKVRYAMHPDSERCELETLFGMFDEETAEFKGELT